MKRYIAASVFPIIFPLPAFAQLLDQAPDASVYSVDDIGVDLKSGKISADFGTLTIGPSSQPIFEYRILSSMSGPESTITDGVAYRNCTIYGTGTDTQQPVGCYYEGYSYRLNGQSDFYMAFPRNPGQSLTEKYFTEKGSMVNANYDVITSKDGAVWSFGSGGLTLGVNNPFGLKGFLSKVTKPDGEVLTYYYNAGELRSIVSTRGYMLHLENNRSPYYSSGNVTIMQPAMPTKVVIINLAVDYCDPMAISCSNLTVAWPSESYSWQSSGVTATDSLGRASRRLNVGSNQFRLEWPSGSWLEFAAEYWRDSYYSGGLLITCDPRTATIWARNSSGQWNYSYNKNRACHGGSNVKSMTSTSPSGSAQSSADGFIDELGRKTALSMLEYSNFFGWDEVALNKITYPGGNNVQYLYDKRLNVTSQLATTADGSGSVTSQAVYPENCANSKTCNKPNYTIDANGNRTDYTYSPDHGGVLTKTFPAGTDGVRPQVRYSYQQLSARYKNASGQFVDGLPIWKLVSESSCKTGGSCAGTADEIVTSYSYDGNLLPTVVAIKNGVGVVLQTITTTYDAIGNVTSVDGPAVGSADTTYYFYDSARQAVGEIGPDPDGAGALRRPAKRRTYNPDGKILLEEVGTVDGVAQSALSAMVVKNFVRNTYDPASGRLVKTEAGQP